VINSTRPRRGATLRELPSIDILCDAQRSKYPRTMTGVLREKYEFPVHEVNVNLPGWVWCHENHWLQQL
jgi:stage IV sporulation protein A